MATERDNITQEVENSDPNSPTKADVLHSSVFNPHERLFKVGEVAEILRVNPETIRRWCRSRKLEAIKPWGDKTGYRIPQHSFDKFMAIDQGESSDKN